MSQKLIKIGTSVAVTLSRKNLEDIGLKIGDKVQVDFDVKNKKVTVSPMPEAKLDVNAEVYAWTKKFIKKYKGALEELSDK